MAESMNQTSNLWSDIVERELEHPEYTDVTSLTLHFEESKECKTKLNKALYPHSQDIRNDRTQFHTSARSAANITERESWFSNPSEDVQRSPSQFYQTELDYLRDQVADLKARLQKKNVFLTAEKDKRIKADEEHQNQLYYWTNEVDVLRGKLQKKNMFLTIQKEKRTIAEQGFSSKQKEVEDLRGKLQNKNRLLTLEIEKRIKAEKESESCWKMLADSEQQRENESRLRRHYEEEAKKFKDIAEKLSKSSKTPNPESQTQLSQVEPQVGNLDKLETLQKQLEKEITSNLKLKNMLRSQEETIQDLEWKVAGFAVQFKMAMDSHNIKIPDLISKQGCLSEVAQAKPDQFSQLSVESDTKVPKPQAASNPQVVSGNVDFISQGISVPEEDFTLNMDSERTFQWNYFKKSETPAHVHQHKGNNNVLPSDGSPPTVISGEPSSITIVPDLKKPEQTCCPYGEN